jgi:pimeloyl-ACP methyl ester carboxylesterase
MPAYKAVHHAYYSNESGRSDRAFGIHMAPSEMRRANHPVRRRRVIYIAGYDPRSPEDAARLILARETTRMATRLGRQAEMSEVRQDTTEPLLAHWTLTAQSNEGPNSAVTTVFDYLRWDDLVAPDFQRPLYARAWRSAITFVDYIARGSLFRMGKATHSTLFLWLYPFLALIAAVIATIMLASLVLEATHSMVGTGTTASILGFIATLGVLAAGYATISQLMRRGYWAHLLDLWIFCRDYALGHRTDVDNRVKWFARHIQAAARQSDVDETLIVGHSFGALLAQEAVGEALILDPAAFTEGAPVCLLCIASCGPTSLAHRTPQGTGKRMQALAESMDVTWIEIQGKQDLINYYRVDPMEVAGFANDPDRPNPVVRGISIKDLVTRPTYKRIRKDFFRNHHQTIMANDHDYPWEFPRLLCGQQPAIDAADDIILKYAFIYGLVEPTSGAKTITGERQ